MLYPDPGVMCREWWLEVTTFGTIWGLFLEWLSSNLVCCTLPYDPPCALQRQEPPKMAIELSVYISILLTPFVRIGFSMQEISALYQTRVDPVTKFAIKSNAENTTTPKLCCCLIV